MAAIARRVPVACFFVLFALLSAASLSIGRLEIDPVKRSAITIGLALDFALTLPIAYYYLVWRPRNGSWIALAFVAALGCFRASMLLPAGAPLRPVLAGAIEAGVLAAIIYRVRAGWKNSDRDPLERIEAAVASVLPSSIAARAVSAELAVFYYAFGRRRAPAEGRVFSIHEQGGVVPLIGFLAVISIVEAAVVHILVHRWSAPVAWVLTAASLYGGVWLVGLARSFAACPLLITESGLLLRKGFLWRLRVPAGSIADVRTSGERAGLRFAVLSEPSVWIRFKEPLEAAGPFGSHKRVTTVSVAPDDAAGFLSAVRVMRAG